MFKQFYIPIDETLLSTPTPAESKAERNGNKGVLHIFQISRIGVSPLQGLVSYPGHSFEASYTTAKMRL